GGDPFVFGRGGEELDYLHRHGIETTIIPGISSATSVPATQGISLTKRGISESFWVITGTTKNRCISDDIRLAAQSTATLVILMGMTHLPQIVAHFQELGKGKLPVAIVQNGYLPEERSAIGTIDTIVGQVQERGLKNPAIIVIGEVVRQRSIANALELQHLIQNQHRA
ncbi:MAG: uroporphyrinogen-III C-methyltransferase, partial [Phaeodactylibacter sp.]|nr:uroporphyrinogen-III C-methyltransferase [Phaeodactylibacter sp.]